MKRIFSVGQKNGIFDCGEEEKIRTDRIRLENLFNLEIHELEFDFICSLSKI